MNNNHTLLIHVGENPIVFVTTQKYAVFDSEVQVKGYINYIIDILINVLNKLLT